MKIFYGILKSAILPPLLFALYPILALWAYNFEVMQPIEVALPICISVLGTLVLLLILRLLSKSWLLAGLLTTLVVLFFFTYGHVFGMVSSLPKIGDLFGRHRVMGLFWFVLLTVGGFIILKYGRKAGDLPLFLNCTGLALLLLTGGQLIYAKCLDNDAELPQNVAALQDKNTFDPSRIADKQTLPDIYFIVLDSYPRHDALLKGLKIDNTPFLNALTDLGFVIPTCNMSNYDNTILSMPSVLNMHYMEDYFPNFDPNATSYDHAWQKNIIRHSLVRKNLSDLGYKTISFETEYDWVEIPDADIYYTIQTPGAFIQDLLNTTEFDSVLSDTSVLRLLTNAEEVSPWVQGQVDKINDLTSKFLRMIGVRSPGGSQLKYQQIMTALDNLEKVPGIPGQKFVYLHLSAPHPNTVLGPNGEYRSQKDSPDYQDTFIYLDKRIPEILGKLINNSKVRPVIILQGDHGMHLFTYSRLDNLMAYYLPGVAKNLVYPSITPVNTFRLVFNAYFDGRYPLLKDASYQSSKLHPLGFHAIPPSCVK
jgi:hypothetical protein